MHLLCTVGVRGQEVVVHEVLLDEDREHRRQQPGIGARADLQVEVGEVGGLGPARVDHDQ